MMRRVGRRCKKPLVSSCAGRALCVGVCITIWATGANAWWTPSPGVSWQWQESGDLVLDLDVDMYNLDLFGITEDDVDALHQNGITVICSFSAGTIAADSPDAVNVTTSLVLGASVDSEAEEWWLDINNEVVLEMMSERLDLAVNKSCDGVVPSNVEVFAVEESGLNVTAEDQITYNTWLADEAHIRNISIGLRNDWTQLEELEPSFDWALSENCLSEGECDTYKENFVLAGKAVLDVEYFQFDDSFCDNITARGLDVIIKDVSLDERRCSCQNPSTDINCEDLLNQGPSSTTGGSSYWVIFVAVGASIVILIVAAGVTVWNRRKSGGENTGSFDFR